VDGLLEAVAANDGVRKAAQGMLAFLGQQAVQLDTQIEQLERRMQQM
jgi:HEAT repeat protein